MKLILISNSGDVRNTLTQFSNNINPHIFKAVENYELCVSGFGFHARVDNVNCNNAEPSILITQFDAENIFRVFKHNKLTIQEGEYKAEDLVQILRSFFVFSRGYNLVRISIREIDAERDAFYVENRHSSDLHLLVQKHLGDALFLRDKSQKIYNNGVCFYKLIIASNVNYMSYPYYKKRYNYPSLFNIHLNIAKPQFYYNHYQQIVYSGSLPLKNKDSYYFHSPPTLKWFDFINSDFGKIIVKITGEDGLNFRLINGHPTVIEILFRKKLSIITNMMPNSGLKRKQVHVGIKSDSSHESKITAYIGQTLELSSSSSIALESALIPNCIANVPSHLTDITIPFTIEHYESQNERNDSVSVGNDLYDHLLGLDNTEGKKSQNEGNDNVSNDLYARLPDLENIDRKGRSVRSITYHHIQLSRGYYRTTAQFIDMLNRNLPQMLRNKLRFFEKDSHIHLSYESSNSGVILFFPNELGPLFGYKWRVVEDNWHEKHYPIKLGLKNITKWKFEHLPQLWTFYPSYLFLYSSAIEKTHVGDKYLPLLKILPLSPLKDDNYMHIEFPVLDFIPCSRGILDYLQLELRDFSGNLAQFDNTFNEEFRKIIFNIIVRI